MIKVLCNDFKKFLHTRADRVIDMLEDDGDFIEAQMKFDTQELSDAANELLNIAVNNAYAYGFLDGITISDKFNS